MNDYLKALFTTVMVFIGQIVGIMFGGMFISLEDPTLLLFGLAGMFITLVLMIKLDPNKKETFEKDF